MTHLPSESTKELPVPSMLTRPTICMPTFKNVRLTV